MALTTPDRTTPLSLPWLLPVLVLLLSWPLQSESATPPQDPAIERALKARFDGDRTGTCVQAAIVEPQGLRRADFCARTADAPKPQAAFEIGSVSKTFTALLVADLIERGRWSLDDPIAKHLPAGAQVPRQGERQITVRDLVTHSSGLPAIPPSLQRGRQQDPYAHLTEAQLLADLASSPLQSPIGSRPVYSNFGMMVLSMAVARAEDGGLDTALRERVFKPLGLTQARLDPAGQTAGHLSTGEPTPPWTITPNLAGVGMLRMPLDDLATYARALLAPSGPLAPALRRVQQPVAHGFAMNWLLSAHNGETLVSHEGGTGGFSSLVLLRHAQQRAVVILADTALADLGGLGDLARALLGLQPEPQAPRRAQPLPASLRDALSGDYDFMGQTLTLRPRAEGLELQVTGQPAFALGYDSRGDLYPLQAISALLSPQREPDGRVLRFAWRQGGGSVEVMRRGATAPKPSAQNPAWRDWAGTYPLVPGFELKVYERDGQLMVQGSGQPAVPVEVTGPDRIEVKALGVVIQFERDAQRAVTGLVLQQSGQTLKGARQ
jgi:CubicO group peptidase (beta-lactamase class C family)